jgi:APA family basic amino acid/polyamine antiporter
MYAYSGWNASTYIMGEVRNPSRTIPLSLGLGTLLVTGLYLAINAVFLRTTPAAELVGKQQVGLIAGVHIFGESGGKVMAVFIALGLVSAVSAMMWIGPRVMMTMGEDIPILQVFSTRSIGGAPAYAILFQLVVATLMLFTRSFEAVLDFIQFALLFCSFFTVLGVIKLRITRPDTPRPYRAWGYPITPVVFLLVTAFMMYYLLTERPLQSALGALIMISGLLIYAVFRRRDDFAISSPDRE